MSASRQLAAVAFATQIGPADLLTAPPAVLYHLTELVVEEQKRLEKEAEQAKHEERLARLKGTR